MNAGRIFRGAARLISDGSAGRPSADRLLRHQRHLFVILTNNIAAFGSVDRRPCATPAFEEVRAHTTSPKQRSCIDTLLVKFVGMLLYQLA
jgi:hypothetical protein